jgi:hypothetical protein
MWTIEGAWGGDDDRCRGDGDGCGADDDERGRRGWLRFSDAGGG